MRKIFLVLTGILMFYAVRILFKKLKRTADRQSYRERMGESQTVLSGGKGRSFQTDRVVEDAEYTEISGDSVK